MGILRILYYRYRLAQNQKKTYREVLQLQQKKLRRLLQFVYQQSSFYRQFYYDHGIREKDLGEIPVEKLPVIDKEILMDNFNEIVIPDDINRQQVEEFLEYNNAPASLFADKYQVIHSSGSSGKIGYYIYGPGARDLIKAASSLRLFDNFSLEPKTYAYIGAADGHYAGISHFLSPINSKLESYFYNDYLVIHINQPLKDYCDSLNHLQPQVLSGYPSGIRILAQMQERHEIQISPGIIITGGELLTPETVNLIKEAWDVIPVNHYSSSESLMIGSGKGTEGLYIYDDLNYVEFKENNILLTNLYNFTQPLIRYQMDDILQVRKQKKGDLPFTEVEKVKGRQEETLWFENDEGEKEFIHPIVFVEFFVRGLKRFQIVQTGSNHFSFKAVIDDDYSQVEVKRNIDKHLRQLLWQKHLNNVEFDIGIVEGIEREESTGKFKLIKKDL